MPPTFLYLSALVVWVMVASMLWLVAAVMSFRQGWRVIARSLALAMAATFPAVFVFQAVAAPIIGAVLVGGLAVCRAIEPGSPATTANQAVIAVTTVVVCFAFLCAALSSIAGFYEGWRLGWSVGRGERLATALWQGPVLSWVARLLSMRRKEKG